MQVRGSIYSLRWIEKAVNFNNSGPRALHAGQVQPEQVSLTSFHVHKPSSASAVAAKPACASFP